MRRAVLILALAAVAGVVVPPTPAGAHGGDTPSSTAFRTRISGVTPAVPGLAVTVVEAGARLELTNDTGRTVEVLGYAMEPYLEVRPDGTYENVHSPAAYLNRTLAGDTPVPAEADPTAPPRWRRISGEPAVRWHDRRTRWTGDGLPPVAAADPGRPHRIRDWVVPLRQEATVVEVRGTLDYRPPPAAWLWWLGAALVALIAFRRPTVAAVAGGALVLYGVLRTLDAAAPVVTFAAGLIGLLSVPLRKAPFALALTGVVLAVFGGLTDIGVFGAAVVPVAGPDWIARAAVMLALGAGVGTAAAGIVRVRRADRVGS